MTAPALPPLLSGDGHLEVLPERWTPRMPAKYRERAPRTVRLPDGGDAIVVEGQPPYPAPFLDARSPSACSPAFRTMRRSRSRRVICRGSSGWRTRRWAKRCGRGR